MTAIVFGPSVVSSLPFAPALLLMVIPIGLLLAPQAIKRDRRTIVALCLLLFLVLAAPVAAEWDAVSNVCEYCPWWLCLECLIYG